MTALSGFVTLLLIRYIFTEINFYFSFTLLANEKNSIKTTYHFEILKLIANLNHF